MESQNKSETISQTVSENAEIVAKVTKPKEVKEVKEVKKPKEKKPKETVFKKLVKKVIKKGKK